MSDFLLGLSSQVHSRTWSFTNYQTKMLMTVRPCNWKSYQDEDDTVSHDLIPRENKGKTCDSDSAMGSLIGLPSDMILELLSRTLFATPDGFRTVARDCKHLIYCPCFASLHYKNTKSLHEYCIQGINLIEGNPFTCFSRPLPLLFSFEQSCIRRVETEGITFLASYYKGIVLCQKWDLRECNYLVCKPETQNWELLPNPKEDPFDNFTFSIGIVVRLVRVIHPTDDSETKTHTILRVDIFNSKLRSWSERCFLNLQPEVRVSATGVQVLGISSCCSIYWLNHDDKGIAFYGHNESLEKFHLPYFHCASEYKRLQEFQGRIGFFVVTKHLFASALTVLMRVRPCNSKAYQDEEDTAAHDLIRILEKKGKTCDTYSAIDSLLGLPSDMILEILSRTSFAMLDVLKTVSRDCRRLIYSPCFASFHCKNTRSLYGYFVQGIRLIEEKCFRPLSRPLSMFFSFEQPPRRVKTDWIAFLASCYKGIVLCLKWNSRRCTYVVGRPETLNWEQLPDPGYELVDNVIFAHGIVVFGSWFKAVRLMCIFDREDDLKIKTPKPNLLRVDIFNSKLGSWREIYVVPPQEELSVNARGVMIPGISAGCSIYWLNQDNQVIVYNGHNETIEIFPLPNFLCACEYMRFQEFQGRIGLVLLTKDGKLELWQLEDGGDGDRPWYKRMEVNIHHLQTQYHFSLFGFHNEEIVYMKAADIIMFYNLNHLVLKRQVKLDSSLESACNVFQYRSG